MTDWTKCVNTPILFWFPSNLKHLLWHHWLGHGQRSLKTCSRFFAAVIQWFSVESFFYVILLMWWHIKWRAVQKDPVNKLVQVIIYSSDSASFEVSQLQFLRRKRDFYLVKIWLCNRIQTCFRFNHCLSTVTALFMTITLFCFLLSVLSLDIFPLTTHTVTHIHSRSSGETGCFIFTRTALSQVSGAFQWYKRMSLRKRITPPPHPVAG